MPKCLYCNYDYISGALYCDSCGRRLPQRTGAPAMTPKPSPPIPEARQATDHKPAASEEKIPETPPHLRLQLSSGIIIDLGSRESILVGRKDLDLDQEPDVDLAPYGGQAHGVGRRHATITLKEGRYYIEDLKSLNETFLNSARLFPGHPYPLHNGDLVKFGALVVKVLL
jgi:pSer/pThr/pTyr-binding forkhead associated (FHA) protein